MKTIRTLTLAEAKEAVQAMEKEAAQMSMDFAFCIVDAANSILLLEKMDGVKSASVDLARAKAMTALRMRSSTKSVGELIKNMQIDIQYWAGSCETAFGGGIPLYENEKSAVPVGAIGVSGGTQEQDQEMAMKGLRALGLATR
jgi:uncharacterized protein GlcG (DUF336 family)